MKPKRLVLPAALIGLAITVPDSARAQDAIVLRVPVEVRSIHPSVSEGQVRCELRDHRGRRNTSSSTTFPLDPNGAHSGVVSVELRPSISWMDRLEGFTYTCELRLDTRPVGKLIDVRQEEYAYLPDTPFTNIVEGEVSLR